MLPSSIGASSGAVASAVSVTAVASATIESVASIAVVVASTAPPSCSERVVELVDAGRTTSSACTS